MHEKFVYTIGILNVCQMPQTNHDVERAKQKAEAQYASLRTALSETATTRVGRSTGWFIAGARSLNEVNLRECRSSKLRNQALRPG
jgi:hypothetical protein